MGYIPMAFIVGMVIGIIVGHVISNIDRGG